MNSKVIILFSLNDAIFRGGPLMRGRGGPPRGGGLPRGGPRGGFRGGPPMRGGGGERGGRFPPGPQGPGPHPVPTIESRGPIPSTLYSFLYYELMENFIYNLALT